MTEVQPGTVARDRYDALSQLYIDMTARLEAAEARADKLAEALTLIEGTATLWLTHDGWPEGITTAAAMAAADARAILVRDFARAALAGEGQQ